MAEWLGKGLQNLVQRFESASDLTKTVLQCSVRRFFIFLRQESLPPPPGSAGRACSSLRTGPRPFIGGTSGLRSSRRSLCDATESSRLPPIDRKRLPTQSKVEREAKRDSEEKTDGKQSREKPQREQRQQETKKEEERENRKSKNPKGNKGNGRQRRNREERKTEGSRKRREGTREEAEEKGNRKKAEKKKEATGQKIRFCFRLNHNFITFATQGFPENTCFRE